MKNISVSIKDVKDNFVSYSYINSNVRRRVKKSIFYKELNNGKIQVVNPERLP